MLFTKIKEIFRENNNHGFNVLNMGLSCLQLEFGSVKLGLEREHRGGGTHL